MDVNPNSFESTQRKLGRFRLRPDLVVTQRLDGLATRFIIKDPVGLRYYQFTEQEYGLLQLMDGRRTQEEVRREFERRYPPERLSLEDFETFIQHVLKQGLIQSETPQETGQALTWRWKRLWQERLARVGNILYIKIPLVDPDRALARILPMVSWIFAPAAMMVLLFGVVAALVSVLAHLEEFRVRLPAAHEFFQLQTAIWLIVALALAKVFHEFGHGICCKRVGGEVHEMGLLFMCLTPCFYCNVSDAWLLPDKRKRILVAFAGVYVELLLAAFATWVWWTFPGNAGLNRLCMSLMVVCSVSTLVFNANPLMRFDGYYMLANWLDIPDLGARASRLVRRLFMEQGLGVELAPEPPISWQRRGFFVTYAIASYVYRWVITFGIIGFLYRALKPYRVEIVAVIMASLTLTAMIGVPIGQLGWSIYRRGRLPDMKAGRVALTSCLGGLLIAMFFLLPLPVATVRRGGIVEVRPEAFVKVFIPNSGVLRAVHVRPGQIVRRGDLLAELTSTELETQIEENLSERDIRMVQFASFRALAKEATDASTVGRAATAATIAEGERDVFDRRAKIQQQWRAALTLRAPRDGTVFGPPTRDEVGKTLYRDQSAPFCCIGDRTDLRVLVPVSPAEYQILADNLLVAQQLTATILTADGGMTTFSGIVSRLPAVEARAVPFGLTQRAGGPLSARPASDPLRPDGPPTFVPQDQHYLIEVALDPDIRAPLPGTPVAVKIHCRWHSLSWWVWRSLCAALDLGVL